jgi:hypothetical protein
MGSRCGAGCIPSTFACGLAPLLYSLHKREINIRMAVDSALLRFIAVYNKALYGYLLTRKEYYIVRAMGANIVNI